MNKSKPVIATALLLLVPTVAFGPGVVSLTQRTSPYYVAVPVAAPAAAQETAAQPADAELARKAYAVLETHCVSCHGNGKRLNRQAAIDKDTWTILVQQQKKIVPGQSDQSRVYTRMIDPQAPMPPRQVPQRPSAQEIALVKQWIDRGAPDWAAVPPEPKAETAPAAPPATALAILPAAPPSPVAPPGAATPASAAAPEIGNDEILIQGIVADVAADGTTLTLRATRFTLPNKRSRAIRPSKLKMVLLNADTTRWPDGSAPLTVGITIQVIGPDAGTGNPLAARAISLVR